MSRLILVLGLLFALAQALFPPWRVERYERNYVTVSALRSDVIAMPARYAPRTETHQRFAFAPATWVGGPGGRALYRGAVDVERLAAYPAFVLGLTFAMSLGVGQMANWEARRHVGGDA